MEHRFVEYEYHDDFTFWYKVNLSDNLEFSYEITSLDENNNFDVYFYKYDGNTFCRSFIQNNLESQLEWNSVGGSNMNRAFSTGALPS